VEKSLKFVIFFLGGLAAHLLHQYPRRLLDYFSLTHFFTMKLKVKKTAFQSLRQGGLVAFVSNVVNRMTDRPEYAAFSDKVQVLKQQKDAFIAALADSAQGGTDRIITRRETQGALMRTLNELAEDLDYHHAGPESWVSNAGFSAVDVRTSTRQGALQPPTKVRALPQLVSGELELRYELPEPKAVRNTGLEFSTDNGLSWQNGTYSSGSVMKVKGLPARQAVLLRLRSIGTLQRMSGWSGEIDLFLI